MDNRFKHCQYINTVVNEIYTEVKSNWPIPQIYSAETVRYSQLCECVGNEIGESYTYFTLRRENELPMVMFSKSARKKKATSLCNYSQCVSWPYAKGLLNGSFDDVLSFGFYSEEEIDILAANGSVPDFGDGSDRKAFPGEDSIRIDREALTAVITRVMLHWLEGSGAVSIGVPKNECGNYTDYVLRAVSEIYSYFPTGLRAEAGFCSYLSPAKLQSYPRIHMAFIPQSEANANTVFLDGSSPLAYARLTKGTILPALKAFIAHVVNLTDRKDREAFIAGVFEDLEGGSSADHLEQFKKVTGLTYNKYGRGLKILDSKETDPVVLLSSWVSYCEKKSEYPQSLCGSIDELIADSVTPDGYRKYLTAACEGKGLAEKSTEFRRTQPLIDLLIKLSPKGEELDAVRNELGRDISERIVESVQKSEAVKSSAAADYYDSVQRLLDDAENKCSVFDSEGRYKPALKKIRETCGRRQAEEAIQKISEQSLSDENYGTVVSRIARQAIERCRECGAAKKYEEQIAQKHAECCREKRGDIISKIDALKPSMHGYAALCRKGIDALNRSTAEFGYVEKYREETAGLAAKGEEKYVAEIGARFANSGKWLEVDFKHWVENFKTLEALLESIDDVICETESRKHLREEIESTMLLLKQKMDDPEGRCKAALEEEKGHRFFEAIKVIEKKYEEFPEAVKQKFVDAYSAEPYNDAVDIPQSVKSFEEGFQNSYGKPLTAPSLGMTGIFCVRVFSRLLEKLYSEPQTLHSTGDASANRSQIQEILTKARKFAPNVKQVSFKIQDRIYSSSELLQLLSFDFYGYSTDADKVFDAVSFLTEQRFFAASDAFSIQRQYAPMQKNSQFLKDILEGRFPGLNQSLCLSLLETQTVMLATRDSGMSGAVHQLRKVSSNFALTNDAAMAFAKLEEKYPKQQNPMQTFANDPQPSKRKAPVAAIVLGVLCAALVAGSTFLFLNWNNSRKAVAEREQVISFRDKQLEEKQKEYDALLESQTEDYFDIVNAYLSAETKVLWNALRTESAFTSDAGSADALGTLQENAFNAQPCLEALKEILQKNADMEQYTGGTHVLPSPLYFDGERFASSADGLSACMILYVGIDDATGVKYAAAYYGEITDGVAEGNGRLVAYAPGMTTDEGVLRESFEYAGAWIGGRPADDTWLDTVTEDDASGAEEPETSPEPEENSVAETPAPGNPGDTAPNV